MAADFHYEVVLSALHSDDVRERLIDGVASKLREINGVGSPADVDATKPFVVVVGTGGTEQTIIDRWETRQGLNPGEPVLVVAHRTDNALPAALEALAAIRARGGSGRIVMIERLADVATAIRHQQAHLRLRRARIGVIGTPSEWLVASRPTADIVKERWGPTLVPVELPTTGEAVPTKASVELGRRWSALDTGTATTTIDRQAVERAATLHGPLQQLMADNDLDAITVRCFDLLSSVETSGCLALAELNASGVVAGCEGDVPSALAMMLARELFGVATWMANPAWVDPVTGEVELAHCTVAPNLVDDVALATHFESGIGVGISGRFRPQPVTLLRIGGPELDACWIADGDLVGSGHNDHLCRTQARVMVEPGKAEALMNRPLGNHLVMIPGHHGRELEAWRQTFVDEISLTNQAGVS